MRPDWDQIKPSVWARESGGDFDALFGFQNRPGGLFDDVKVTDMSVNEALDFSNPRGAYANYVNLTTGVTSTPMGVNQVVGTTLRDAARGLSLRGNEKMTPALQDKIGRYIYDTQGTAAYEGYTGPAYGPKGQDNTMQPNLPRGLLEELGVQKMQPGAAGETGQRFYDRDSFKDLAGRLAVGFNSLTLNPDPNIAKMVADRRDSRTQRRVANKTVEYLRKNGMAEYADAVESGSIGAKEIMSALMSAQMAVPKQTALQREYADAVTGGFKGSLVDYQVMLRNAGRTQINTGAKPKPQAGYQFEYDKEGNIISQKLIPGGPAAGDRQNVLSEIDAGLQQTGEGIALIDSIVSNPALGGITGSLQGNQPAFLIANKQDLLVKIQQIQGKAFLAAFESLKGGGSITENEGKAATQAIARLDRSQSAEAFQASLLEFKGVIQGIQNRLFNRKNAMNPGAGGELKPDLGGDGFSITGEVK